MRRAWSFHTSRVRRLAITALAAGVCLLAGAMRVHAESVRATRGLASHVDVRYSPQLRSRSDQSPTSPVLVRVAPSGEAAGTQRIEFIGNVAGAFDLRDFVEREDGRAITDLEPLPVLIGSQLPADAGTDLYSSGGSWFNWAAHYRTLLWGAVALWASIPVVVFVARLLRKPQAVVLAPPPPPPITLEEQLRTAIADAAGRDLSIDERGRLELLALRYLSEQGGRASASLEDLATLVQELRQDERSAPVVLAMERWLHDRDGERARADAARVLDKFRRSSLAGPSAATSAAAGGGA